MDIGTICSYVLYKQEKNTEKQQERKNRGYMVSEGFGDIHAGCSENSSTLLSLSGKDSKS